MNESIKVGKQFNDDNSDSKIIKIQKNLIMMEFDIEMINKIILYFNIDSEDQAIDYLTKNSEGIWGHPFIPRINDEINNDIIENKPQENDKNSISIIGDMKSKINTIKSKGISDIIYYQMNDEQLTEQKELCCDICGEQEKYHIKTINNINEKKKDLIEDSKFDDNNINDDNSNINKNMFTEDNFINENKNNYNFKISNNNMDNNIDNNNIDNNINNKIDDIKNNNQCPICLCDLENKVELEKCHHKYCRECFNNYLMDLINKNSIDKIPCPIKSCFNKEIKEEFFRKYLSEEQYFKYRTFRSQNEIARDPKKMFCPLCDGYAPIEEKFKYKYDPNDPKYTKSTITCINGHNFCSCGIALHEGDCYRDTNDFQKFLINEHVKQCPKCGFYIKKLKGCNHMTCGNALCKYEFCWLCMKEAVPGHFEYGQCKGMQFINPNSFMFKLSRNHPYLYKLFLIIRVLIVLGIILFVLFFIPGLIVALSLLFIFLMNNFPYKELIRRMNIYSRFLYFLSVSLIIISLQNIAHLLICLLIINFIFILIISIIGNSLRIIYRCLRSLRPRIE